MKNTRILLAVLIMPVALILNSCEKKEGCTDSISYTYDSEAEEDDGSCKYSYGGKNYGQLDIGALKSMGEDYDIYFDGNFIGTLQHYFESINFCGSSDAVGKVVNAGDILVEAKGKSTGTVLYATVNVDPQECATSVLDYFKTGSGGTDSDSGTDDGSGGGSTCDWMASTNCVTITTEWGVRCNSTNSMEVYVKNTCSGAIKVYICVQEEDGTYSNWADGTFDSGLAVGEVATGYACAATGKYLVGAMPIDDYVDGDCPWPSNCQ